MLAVQPLPRQSRDSLTDAGQDRGNTWRALASVRQRDRQTVLRLLETEDRQTDKTNWSRHKTDRLVRQTRADKEHVLDVQYLWLWAESVHDIVIEQALL